MAETTNQKLIPRTVVAGALALGIIGGGYGIANAATGTGTGTSGTTAAATPATTLPAAGVASTAVAASTPATGQGGSGGQRADETLLTGDTLAKVTAAAKAKVPGGTIVRVETDADGHAAYEAHMTAADGSETTVYVDKSFSVVSVGAR
jgi:Peptidase propeptide and YPEB domain